MATRTPCAWKTVECDKLFPAQDLSEMGTADMAADWAAVQAAVRQLRDDIRIGQTQLAEDEAAVSAERQAALRHSPEWAQWRADLAAAGRKIRADRHRVNRAARADVGELIADYQRLQADSDDAISTAVNRARLLSHQSRLHSEVCSAAERLLDDKARIHDRIHHDKAAIRSMLESHPGYTTAVAAQKRNRSAFQARVKADRAVLQAARLRLRRDKAAAARDQAVAAGGEEWKPYFG
jgi:hypothetical protein